MPTFYTEVLKLFTPYQGGGLDIVTEQTHDGFASVQPVLWRLELSCHGVVEFQQFCGDVFEVVDVQLLVERFPSFHFFSVLQKVVAFLVYLCDDFVDRVGVVGTQNVLGTYIEVLQHLLVRIEGVTQAKDSVHTPCLFQLIQQVRQEKRFSALLFRHAKHEASQAYVVSGCVYREGWIPQFLEGLDVDRSRLHLIYA